MKTVKQLIEELQKYPEDLLIQFFQIEFDSAKSKDSQIKSVIIADNGTYISN